MIISLIAAIGKNNELGKNNQLLWNLPDEMKYFRETTKGHPVIMGRKTFESIGRTLPNRRNIVITRDTLYAKEGIEVVHSLDAALQLFTNLEEEVFVIGGAQIYAEAIDFADKLYITRVNSLFNADTFFPNIDPTIWQKVKNTKHAADETHAYDFTFEVLEKIVK